MPMWYRGCENVLKTNGKRYGKRNEMLFERKENVMKKILNLVRPSTRRSGNHRLSAALAVALVLNMTAVPAAQAETSDEKIARLEKIVQILVQKVETLENQSAHKQVQDHKRQQSLDDLTTKVAVLETAAPIATADHSFDKLHIGGYGDIHVNFQEADGADIIDFHRLVLYFGYDFSDWIKFHSEWELEHAFVSDSADGSTGGEFVIEQAYVDFHLSDPFNVRAGRILTPLGIINEKHEPTTFNGVERPSFAKHIIPSTWSSDGLGVFGSINPSLSYQAYIVGGLDGSGFSSSGIRGGRIKERASLHDPAVTGRLDFLPCPDKDLRFGVSGYYGGLNNGNEGARPGVDAKIAIVSADFEYSVGKFDFRGVVAHTDIDDTSDLASGTAEETFGWYAEAGYHFMPDEWKKGKLAKADAVAFVRYDVFDTQYEMPSGVAADPSLDRREWTLGVNFYLTPQFVVKADYQNQQSEAGKSDDRFNLGLGFEF